MINIGYFRDFLSDPEVLLIDVDATGLREFCEFAAALANGRSVSLGSELAVHGFPWIAFELSDRNDGLVRAESVWTCRWSREKWASVAEQLQAMVEHSGPCHQFIDDENDGLTIIVSMGEYGSAWWSSCHERV
jgi:hypothetical protein